MERDAGAVVIGFLLCQALSSIRPCSFEFNVRRYYNLIGIPLPGNGMCRRCQDDLDLRLHVAVHIKFTKLLYPISAVLSNIAE